MAINITNPTVTASVSVKSTTISNAAINAYCNFTMRQRGSLTDNLDISSGVQRFSPGQTGATTIITASLVTADKIGYVYIKNLATTAGHRIHIYDDTTSGDPIQFQLDAGDWGFIPMHGDKTYEAYSPGGNDPTVEWMVMGKDQ